MRVSMPALLTSTSIRPYCATATSMSRRRSATLLTSASTPIASLPARVISSSSSSVASGWTT